MQKNVGPLQQHLRWNVRDINTSTEALEIVYRHVKSRHLIVPSGSTDYQGQADMDIGALNGKKGHWKGKGHKGGKGMFQRKKDTKAKERAQAKAQERAKDTKEKETDNKSE